ncbi:ABC transporter permease [Paenactinomyces guangxiensis]|uniref:ABC-2 family transporter protein n=1 Tax=Paenactinomyces guangxiensis TaxID=1490290 RepID=A0A7W1WSZ6_9BACL|nr:ABC-2 family transporter protein [Paenactinomyces guangxiensis]MBA4495419.1 ABC-2 family transporter protein [Paenactinomyces guangxiensis]MBH8592460.1 ABC-2 family transporter protein [Paenactinomyces guangxiensis]
MYWEVIRIRFLMMLAYRVNYYSGIVIYSLNIGVYFFLWMAIYGDQSSLQGLTAVQMATYIAVSWMARAFYFNNLDREIAQEIRDGTVAIQLIRPYHYLLVKAFQGFGEGMFRLLLFSVPGMIVVSLIFPIHLPVNAEVWYKFALSLVLGFIVNVQVNILTGICAFFILNNQGLIRAKRVAVDLLSGLVIPIPFYPEWAQTILSYLPFQAISYLPSMVLVKGLAGTEFIHAILVQAAWCVLLWIPIRAIWKKARKTLIVQGG